MTAGTYIGSIVSIVAATPATEDYAGFAALSYTAIGEVMIGPGSGDESEGVEYTTLAGRKKRVNGAKDGLEREFSYQYEKLDPGQIICRTNNNTNTKVAVKVVDIDGEIEYFGALVANLTKPPREASTLKGQSGVFRVNTATFTSP
jgi:hypothetical protein